MVVRPILLACIVMFGGAGCSSGPRPTGPVVQAERVLSVTYDISPDGQMLIFAGNGPQSTDLFLMNLATGKVDRLTFTKNAVEGWPRYAADGSVVVYSQYDAGHLRVFTMRADGKQPPEAVSPKGWNAAVPEWGSESNSIFATMTNSEMADGWGGSPRAGPWDYWEFKAGKARQISHGRLFLANPLYQIAPEVAVFTDWEKLYRLNLATGDITELGPGVYDLTSSGARKRLAGVEMQDAKWRLIEMDLSGGSRRILVEQDIQIAQPRYTLGGKLIYYMDDPVRNGRYRLWRLDTATLRKELVATSDLFFHPSSGVPYKLTESAKEKP